MAGPKDSGFLLPHFSKNWNQTHRLHSALSGTSNRKLGEVLTNLTKEARRSNYESIWVSWRREKPRMMSDVGTDIQRGQSHLQLSWEQLETKLRAIRLWEPSRKVSCFAGKRLLSEEMAFSTFQWMWPPAAVMNSLLIESCPFSALHTIFLWILMGYARVQLPREHFWAGTGAQEYMGICGPK